MKTYEKLKEVLKNSLIDPENSIHLTKEETQYFIESIVKEPTPSEALIKLFKTYATN